MTSSELTRDTPGTTLSTPRPLGGIAVTANDWVTAQLGSAQHLDRCYELVEVTCRT
jgi:hypothetical protein